MRKAYDYVTRPGTYLFLIVLTLLAALMPILESQGSGIVAGAFTVVVITGLASISSNHWQGVAALLLGAAWLVLVFTGLFVFERRAGLPGNILFATFSAYAVWTLSSYIVKAEKVDGQVIAAGIIVYLLLAVIWAMLYFILEQLTPGSFSLAPAEVNRFSSYLYFSLTTISTLGPGDTVPLTPVAKIWTAMEAICGVLFIAVFVARLVGLFRK